MSVVILIFSKKSLRSGFWTSLFVPCPVELVINFTALSTLEITTLSMAVKIASCMRFLTVMTALPTTRVIWLSVLFSRTWFWWLFLLALSKPLGWPLVCWSKFTLSETFTFTLLPITKSFKVSSNWLSCLLCWFFFLRVETSFTYCLINQVYSYQRATKLFRY